MALAWGDKRVLVLSLDGNTARVRDHLGKVDQIRLDLSPSSIRPRAGEHWILTKLGNGWVFSYLDGPPKPPSLTYSRTGETTAQAQLRAALVALGLVEDHTTT
jgi:hypothetical protein